MSEFCVHTDKVSASVIDNKLQAIGLAV